MDSKIIQTPVEHLYDELEKLKTSNASRKTDIRHLKLQIDETRALRDELNAEVKRISGEIKKLKDKRDSLNSKVKDLKTKRDELRDEASKKREALSKLLEQARQISEQLRGSMSDVLTQIKGLDWYIQTNPLSTQAERNLVAKISALEVNLAKHKGLRKVRDNLLRLKVEVGALRIQAQATHEELTKIAEESEKVHTAMQELVRVLSEKKKEADQEHAKYIEQNKERNETLAAFRNDLKRIDEIRAQIGEAKVSSKAEKAEKLRSKYKDAANEKLRTGGKLSFEEFQALMGDSVSDSDED
jgi:uncharacterized coiled-coil DUF342 family protein